MVSLSVEENLLYGIEVIQKLYSVIMEILNITNNLLCLKITCTIFFGDFCHKVEYFLLTRRHLKFLKMTRNQSLYIYRVIYKNYSNTSAIKKS